MIRASHEEMREVAHPFMSNAWFDAILKIRDEIGEIPVNQAIQDIVINLVVTDGPDGDQEMHVKPGSFGRGLAENAPTKLTMPYEIARNLFVERDQQVAVEAFMAGRIRIDPGDERLQRRRNVTIEIRIPRKALREPINGKTRSPRPQAVKIPARRNPLAVRARARPRGRIMASQARSALVSASLMAFAPRKN